MIRPILAILVAAVLLTGCDVPEVEVTGPVYSGPEVTRIIVDKADRKMYLMHDSRTWKSYDVELGFTPQGDKVRQGDGRTPEGEYFINRRNNRSIFHLSLGINYPNAQDRAEARALGVSPGGDIFIHGARRKTSPIGPDWTAGCISVENHEIEEIWKMVSRNGVPVTINP